jgi:hypothetical protein
VNQVTQISWAVRHVREQVQQLVAVYFFADLLAIQQEGVGRSAAYSTSDVEVVDHTILSSLKCGAKDSGALALHDIISYISSTR